MSARKGTPNARKGKAMTLWRGTQGQAVAQYPRAAPMDLPPVDRETIARESAAAMRLAREVLGEPPVTGMSWLGPPTKIEQAHPRRMPVFA